MPRWDGGALHPAPVLRSCSHLPPGGDGGVGSEAGIGQGSECVTADGASDGKGGEGTRVRPRCWVEPGDPCGPRPLHVTTRTGSWIVRSWGCAYKTARTVRRQRFPDLSARPGVHKVSALPFPRGEGIPSVSACTPLLWVAWRCRSLGTTRRPRLRHRISRCFLEVFTVPQTSSLIVSMVTAILPSHGRAGGQVSKHAQFLCHTGTPR